MYVTTLALWYTIKYNQHTWERMWGVAVRSSRSPVLPGNPAYPLLDPRPNPEDYNDFGFKQRTALRPRDR